MYWPWNLDALRGAVLIKYLSTPDHVVNHVTATHCARTATGIDIICFPDLYRANITIFSQAGWNAWNIAPPVRRPAKNCDVLGTDDQIGFSGTPETC